MRYSDFKIFRFDFVFLYCLIYKIAQDMNAGNTVFSQLMSLIPADYKLNYILAIGYPNEAPNAKPHDAAKVKFVTSRSALPLGSSENPSPLKIFNFPKAK